VGVPVDPDVLQRERKIEQPGREVFEHEIE
jgi:hypothetical protein